MEVKPGQMVQFFPKEIKTENFAIKHRVLSPEEVKREQLRGAMGGAYAYYEVRGLEPGTYINLIGKGHGIMMSDTAMEYNTNWQILNEANGDVLIAGLGIGLVPVNIQDNPKVRSITIIEKEQEIIDMVVPQVPFNEKVSIICADIFEWRPTKGDLFDVIYFDIWDEVCSDNNPEMCRLHRSFARKLNRSNPKAFMTSWRVDDVRRLAYERY